MVYAHRSEISDGIHSEHFLVLGNSADMVATLDILCGEILHISRTFLCNT